MVYKNKELKIKNNSIAVPYKQGLFHQQTIQNSSSLFYECQCY